MVRLDTSIACGVSRAFNPRFFGLNNAGLSGMMLANGAALADFMPGVLRYPGGAIANYWNWRTGRMTSTQPLPARYQHWNGQQPVFRLEDLRTLTRRCSADTSFVLNMLSSTLDDQLEMLRTARRLGIPLTYVELGNEYYLNGIGHSEYAHAFPTATDYARLADTWARAVRLQNPNTQIGALIAVEPGSNLRQRGWNGVVATLPSVDGFVVHDYVDPALDANAMKSAQLTRGLRAQEQIREHSILQREGGVERVMRPLFETYRERARYLAPITKRFPTYHTEFNLEDHVGAVRGTWAHGLFAVALAAMIALVPGARTGFYHSFSSEAGTEAFFADRLGLRGVAGAPPTVTGTLSAAGAALRLLMRSARGATQVCELRFVPNPSLGGSQGDSIPSLFGLILSGETRAAVVVNLSPNFFHASVDEFGFQGFERLSGDPASYIGNDSWLVRKAVVGRVAAITLAPYSLTLLSTRLAHIG